MDATLDLTIRDVVAGDYRTAALFQRYGLDFGRQGARTINHGCRGVCVDPQVLISEPNAATASQLQGTPLRRIWDADSLATMGASPSGI